MADVKRILIVDDDAGIRRVIRTCLDSDGHLIFESSDGAAALELIAELTPDLVLLDIAMPVLDGLSVLAEIHDSQSKSPSPKQVSLTQLPPKPLPRVIVMTAHGSVRTAIQAMQLGATDFIEKPFNPTELRQSVANALANALANGEVKTTPVNDADSLHPVRTALRRGKYYAAEAALSKAVASGNDTDPDILNLMGVLHEAHGRREAARSQYEKAIAIDPQHRASRKNILRLEQIDQRGSTQLDVALGDEIDKSR